jgi:phage N-6-adenine-methyltransferase
MSGVIVSIEWETPDGFFNTLNDEFGFQLDVCARPQNAKCQKFFSPEVDGLTKDWEGVCWMNPPYNRNIGLWLKKAYEASRMGATVVCLIQGRSTDTKWWHDYVMKSDEIRFIKNRLHFGLNKVFRRANISSAVVVFRPNSNGFPKICSIDCNGYPLNESNQKPRN